MARLVSVPNRRFRTRAQFGEFVSSSAEARAKGARGVFVSNQSAFLTRIPLCVLVCSEEARAKVPASFYAEYVGGGRVRCFRELESSAETRANFCFVKIISRVSGFRRGKGQDARVISVPSRLVKTRAPFDELSYYHRHGPKVPASFGIESITKAVYTVVCSRNFF